MSSMTLPTPKLVKFQVSLKHGVIPCQCVCVIFNHLIKPRSKGYLHGTRGLHMALGTHIKIRHCIYLNLKEIPSSFVSRNSLCQKLSFGSTQCFSWCYFLLQLYKPGINPQNFSKNYIHFLWKLVILHIVYSNSVTIKRTRRPGPARRGSEMQMQAYIPN